MSELFQEIVSGCQRYKKDPDFRDYNEQEAIIGMKRYCKSAEKNRNTEQQVNYSFRNESLKGYSPMEVWCLWNCANRSKDGTVDIDNIGGCAMAHASYRWLKDKIYYKFDKELEDGIKAGGISATEDVPAALLNRLPYSSFFVETRGGFSDDELNDKLEELGASFPKSFKGFFCTVSPRYQYNERIDALVNTGDKVMDITIYCIADNGEKADCTVSMVVPKEESPLTIKEAMISRVNYEPLVQTSYGEQREYHEKFSKVAHLYDLALLLDSLQYILYLCAENNQVKEIPQPKPKVWASKKKKAAATVKIFSVSEPEEDREPIQKVFPPPIYKGSSSHGSGVPTGKTMPPHTRRGHWAYRWVGHGSEKELKLRWIRETRVHPELETPGAVVKVKESTE